MSSNQVCENTLLMRKNRWPSADGRDEQYPKVPTKIRLLPDGSHQWGLMIPKDAHPDEVIEWFKLGLDPDHIPAETENLKAKLSTYDIDDLVTRYLDSLGETIMRIIETDISRALFTALPVHYVVTVPAIWNDLAKQRTLKAFEAAKSFKDDQSRRAVGGTSTNKRTVTLLSEPEAAATFALDDLVNSGLQVGQTVLVVDAGGGTVDLVSYTVTSLTPTFEVSEAAPGSGGMCGSSYIDERFSQWLRAKIGQEKGFNEETFEAAMVGFSRSTKRQLSMADLANGMFTVPCPGLENNAAIGIRRGRLNIKGTDMHLIFEPVISQVLKLVNDQIAATGGIVHKILLVGGFGTSVYLRARIEQAMEAKGKVEVIQPNNPQLAVVQGALLRGMALTDPLRLTRVKVKERVARKHYGMETSVRYNQAIHHSIVSKKYFDGMDNHDCVDTMDWFIRRGEPIIEAVPYRKNFFQVSRASMGRPAAVHLVVYSDATSETAPLAKNGNVKLLCHVEASLAAIPDDQLPNQRGADGHNYYNIDCDIEAACKYLLVVFLEAF
ncbi:hypothetical protein BJ166DRAFT_493009 [Pestalotiopsis sp. NC0098]|nr:hypothetical protein BJ166DRAFT_493009 [Pestalotiopsis sp. NC0098]